MDTSRPPLGERQRKALLAEIVGGGDTAEKHYLEIKRQLDFSSKEESTKVAKFILAAANRSVATAARHFGGYAVMVIGAEQGHLPGVPAGTEVLHVEQKISKYLGPDGPAWELERLPADTAGQEVLFILVDPPKDGDPIYVCRAEFQGIKAGMANGDIYVRAQGQTRKATAAEIDELVSRAGRKPVKLPQLTVGLAGDAHFLDPTPAALSNFIEGQVSEARAKYMNSPPANGPTLFAGLNAEFLRGEPSRLSPKAFDTQAREWEEQLRAQWEDKLGRLAGAALPRLVIEVGNTQPGFLEAVRVDIVLREARAEDAEHPENVRVEKLFPPVIKVSDPYARMGFGPLDLIDIRRARPWYPLKWRNVGEDLHITIELEQLRPGTPWVNDGDEFVVIARQSVAALSGTWRATVRGHHQAFEGAVELPVEGKHNIKTLYQRLDQLAKG